MPSLGFPELLLILLIIVLLFGATRLPRTARAVGEAISNFREALTNKQSNERN